MDDENPLSGQQIFGCLESGEQQLQSERPCRQVHDLQSCYYHKDEVEVDIPKAYVANQQTHWDEKVEDVYNFQAEVLSVALHDDYRVGCVDAAVEQVPGLYLLLQVDVTKHPVHIVRKWDCNSISYQLCGGVTKLITKSVC